MNLERVATVFFYHDATGAIRRQNSADPDVMTFRALEAIEELRANRSAAVRAADAPFVARALGVVPDAVDTQAVAA